MCQHTDDTNGPAPDGPPAGQSADDPYDEFDVDTLPEWWSQAVEEFREHDLRPYRPPRFADDVLTPPIIDRLEKTYNAEIRFMGVGVSYGDDWGVYVDGDQLRTVQKKRVAAGFTRFDVTSETFEAWIHEHFDGE